jgi:hypothetical protein
VTAQRARILTLVGIMSLLLIYSGCDVIAEQQRQQRFQAADKACEALYADARLDPIRGKVALNNSVKQTTFAMRTDTKTVSPGEKPLIALWADKREQCFRVYDPALEPLAAPQVVVVWHAMWGATDAAIAELYLGRITYGDFAVKRLAISEESDMAIADIRQALFVQNAQLANEEAANFERTDG